MKSPTHSFASSSSGSYSVNNTENGKKISPPKETINGKPLPPPIGTKPVTPPKPQTPPKPSKPQFGGVATTEPLKPSEEPAGEEEEEMPDLQDQDVQRVTKKMQFAFRSKKPPVTPPKPSKPQVVSEEPPKPQVVSEEPVGEEEEEMPDLQDKEVQAVTKKMQFAFRSKKPKAEVPVPPPAVSVPAVPLPVSVPATAVLLKLADEKSSSPEKSERISEAKSVSSQRSSSTEEKSSADR